MILELICLLLAPVPEHLFPEPYPLGTIVYISYIDFKICKIIRINGQKRYYLEGSSGIQYDCGWTESELKNGLNLLKSDEKY